MKWFKSNSKKSEEFRIPGIRFLGEQDGSPERELKAQLTEIFRGNRKINCAYLARVEYDKKSPAVALCLGFPLEPDRVLAERVGDIFASLFGRHEHLDIVFLCETQEAQLLRVCKPFFKQDGR